MTPSKQKYSNQLKKLQLPSKEFLAQFFPGNLKAAFYNEEKWQTQGWICYSFQHISLLTMGFTNYGEEKYKPVFKYFILEKHASVFILTFLSHTYLSCSPLYCEWDKTYVSLICVLFYEV